MRASSRAHLRLLSFPIQTCRLSTHSVGHPRTFLKLSTKKSFSLTGAFTNSEHNVPRYTTQARRPSVAPCVPDRSGYVVVAQWEESEEVRHDFCDIRYDPCTPIGPPKMRLRVAAVDARIIVHCPVPQTTPEHQPTTAPSQSQNGKPHAEPDASRSVGPGLYVARAAAT